MADHDKELFTAEVRQYLDGVSQVRPVGLCERCLAMRFRDEVINREEACAVDVLEQPYDVDPEGPQAGHTWKAFRDRHELESYLKVNWGRRKDLLERAQVWFASQSSSS